jgi:DNA-binding transcriptional LysR family regulator
LQFIFDTQYNSTWRINTKVKTMAPEALPDIGAREMQAALAVAHYRSFIAAAMALGMSQPAMTRMIRRVEDELKVTLFDRSTRHVSITDAGKEFIALAQRLLNDLKINVAHLRRMSDQPRGQVVVTSVFSLADAMLPSLVEDYGKQFPGIELHLREGLHGTVRDEVRSGLADFGIGYIEDAAETFATEDLGVERFYVIAPADHILAARKSVTLSSLAAFPFVSFPVDSLTRTVIDQTAAADGFSLRYLATSNRLLTLQGLVRNRVGLAIVPEKERPMTSDTQLVSRPIVSRQLSRRIGVLRLHERALTPAATKFLNVVRRWMRRRTFRPLLERPRPSNR